MTKPRMITYNGETRKLSEWARIYGMPPGTLHNRLNHQGMDIAEALNVPVKVVRATVTYNGREMSFDALAKLNGTITRDTAYDRYQSGWTPEEIVMTPNNKRRADVSDGVISAGAIAKNEREALKERIEKAAELERQRRLHKPDTTQCKTCQFRGRACGSIICDYASVAGHCRLSPPSPNCTVYVKGKPIITEAQKAAFKRRT